MPRGKHQPRQQYHIPRLAHLQEIPPPLKQQCCVVCYKNFTPFEFNSEVWDSNMIKNFYLSLDIENSLKSDGGDGDDDEVLSLPFCPQCHTKVSVMAAYQIELQNIRSKYNSIRNDLAFTIVETISQNSRDGPIDFIRQQIHDKWKMTYDEYKAPVHSEDKMGLEYIASERSATPHNCGNFICICHSQQKNSCNDVTNRRIFVGGNTAAANEDQLGIVDFENARLSVTSPRKDLQMATIKPELVTRECAPPLLSPQKGFRDTVKGGIQSRFSTSLISDQKRRNVLCNKLTGGRRRLPGRPGNSGLRKSIGFPLAVPKLSNRFAPHSKSFVNDVQHIPGGVYYNDEEQGLIKSKRKVSEMESESTEPRKVLKASQRPQVVATVEPVPARKTKSEGEETFSSSVTLRPTRNSGLSPLKSNEDMVIVPCLDGEGLFPCAYCPKVYTARNRLLRHESDTHPECKMYQCDVNNCGKGFSSKEAFKRHVHNTHLIPNAEIEMHKCIITNCQKTFVSALSLERHTAEAHNDHEQIQEGEDLKSDSIPIAMDEDKAIVADINDQAQIPADDDMEAIGEEKSSGTPNQKSPANNSTEIGDYESMDHAIPIDVNAKLKRKPTANRLFGVRRKKRGAAVRSMTSKLNKLVDDSKVPIKRQQKRVHVVMQPIRKSSRQRGVQLNSGDPTPSESEELDNRNGKGEINTTLCTNGTADSISSSDMAKISLEPDVPENPEVTIKSSEADAPALADEDSLPTEPLSSEDGDRSSSNTADTVKTSSDRKHTTASVDDTIKEKTKIKEPEKIEEPVLDNKVAEEKNVGDSVCAVSTDNDDKGEANGGERDKEDSDS